MVAMKRRGKWGEREEQEVRRGGLLVRAWSGAQSDEIADERPTSLIRTRGNVELGIVAYKTCNEHDDGNLKLGVSVFRSAAQGPVVLGR